MPPIDQACLTALRALLDRDIQLIPYGPFRNPWFQQQVEATKVLIYGQATTQVAV